MQNVQLIYICTFRLIYIWNLGKFVYFSYYGSIQVASNMEVIADFGFHPLSRSTPKTQLKECKQQPGETLIAYYDDIRDLCKQVDTNIPLHMIVDYLQDGLRHELKIHVERQLKALNDEHTPAMFSKIACDEEELHITTPTVLPNKSRINHFGTQDNEDLINHIYNNTLIDSDSSITIIHHHFLQRIHRNTFEPIRPSYI
ncbi:unnamed protein product [Rotaria magnacalcarata]|uniref:Retrotransposon gag domain-containing protein n=1 Tax=Rotaria magnacalcarata TaxID=392030 RepID=A0A820FCD4_9BILA|nr:unnamed protein product [Rotaria magnacalcarata]